MAITVELPALGESVVEGTITKWLVKEGDRVERDQPLVEVSTDKVDAEIPAPEAGVIERILAPEGETVPVGAALVTIATGARRGGGAEAGRREASRAEGREAAPREAAAAGSAAAPRRARRRWRSAPPRKRASICAASRRPASAVA